MGFKLWLARTFFQKETQRILDAKADAEQWHPGTSFVLDLEALGLRECIMPTCKRHISIKADTCPRCGVYQKDNNLPPLLTTGTVELHTEPIPKVDITARDTMLMPVPLLSARTVALRRQAREQQKAGKR